MPLAQAAGDDSTTEFPTLRTQAFWDSLRAAFRADSGCESAIGDRDDAVAVVGHSLVVRDDDRGGTSAFDFVADEFHDTITELSVERGGGFVEENEFRFVHQRATDRNSLAFAAGELGRKMATAMTDSELIEKLVGAGAGRLRRAPWAPFSSATTTRFSRR